MPAMPPLNSPLSRRTAPGSADISLREGLSRAGHQGRPPEALDIPRRRSRRRACPHVICPMMIVDLRTRDLGLRSERDVERAVQTEQQTLRERGLRVIIQAKVSKAVDESRHAFL